MSGQPAFRTARGPALDAMHAAAGGARGGGGEPAAREPELPPDLPEFHDGSGAPLQDRLDALGVGAADYLSLVVFATGPRGGPAAATTCSR